MNTTTETFDDADQLGQVLQYTKGSDKLRFSTPADARALAKRVAKQWTEHDYLTPATGHQMAAVKAMLDRLALAKIPPGPVTPEGGLCATAANAERVARGRAYTWFGWWYFARGSNDYLGSSAMASTTLRETSPDSFEHATSCP
ncbi:MAG: hypothetical protein KA945_03645 [Zoogloea sp.]|nr:hypothetical protein [Zoogloea sp.]